jgi:hypothetical protein
MEEEQYSLLKVNDFKLIISETKGLLEELE